MGFVLAMTEEAQFTEQIFSLLSEVDSRYRTKHLMLADTTTGGLCVLTTDLDLPVVTETTVKTDLLHALNIITELGIKTVGHTLSPFALFAVLLTVEEPVGDVELTRVGDDGLDGLNLVFVQLTGTLVQVDVSLLADKVGETSANTTNFGQRNADVITTIDVRVQNTQDVLEFSVFQY